MPLIINKAKVEDKVITMGKEPVADYYPPGATEPQVRPANVPAEQKEDPPQEPKEDPKEGTVGGTGKPKVPETSRAVGKKK